MYRNNESKFVSVLNEKIAPAQLMNTLGHLAAGLAGHVGDSTAMKFLKYEDADGGVHAGISYYPFIVLKARNSNQIRTLRRALIEAKIPYTDFVGTMLGASAEEQLEQTKARPEQELEYFGVCTFGPSAVLNELTRKFSLFK